LSDSLVQVENIDTLKYALRDIFFSGAMARKKRNTKYIFVAGGVMSGIGKGITASSIAKILQLGVWW